MGEPGTDRRVGRWAQIRFNEARQAARSRTGLSLGTFLVASIDQGPQHKAVVLRRARRLGLLGDGDEQRLWDTRHRLGIVEVVRDGTRLLVYWQAPAGEVPGDPEPDAGSPPPDSEPAVVVQGDRQEFWRTYRRDRKYIKAVARRRLGERYHKADPDAAERLGLEAFVKAWNRRQQLHHPDAWRHNLRHPSSWKPWLRAVVVNYVRDYLRSPHFGVTVSMSSEELDGLVGKGADVLDGLIEREVLDAAVVELLSNGEFKVAGMDTLEYLKNDAPLTQVVDCRKCRRLLIGRRSLDWLMVQKKRDRERLGLLPVAGRLDGFSYCKACLPEVVECQGCGRDCRAGAATAVRNLLYCPGCVDKRKAS